MANQVFSAEFKEEAIRQIVERGYAVKEVSQRLGVSTHSLYKWVKAVKPEPGAKREILTLKAELRRTQEERDILKKAAAYFAREPG